MVVIGQGEVVRHREFKSITVNKDAGMVDIVYREWYTVDDIQIGQEVHNAYSRRYEDISAYPQVQDLLGMIALDLTRDNPQEKGV